MQELCVVNLHTYKVKLKIFFQHHYTASDVLEWNMDSQQNKVEEIYALEDCNYDHDNNGDCLLIVDELKLQISL